MQGNWYVIPGKGLCEPQWVHTQLENHCSWGCRPSFLLQVELGISVAGAKLEETEVRSVASNQSEMEYSSLQDMVRPGLLLCLVGGKLGPSWERGLPVTSSPDNKTN